MVYTFQFTHNLLCRCKVARSLPTGQHDEYPISSPTLLSAFPFNTGFIHKSTAHRKVPLHTNAVHPLFGHIYRTIEDPVPSRAPNGSMSRVPQCQPHCTPQSQKYLQSQHSPHHHRAESVCPLKWEQKDMRLSEEPIKSKTAALSAPTLEPPVWRDEMETATGCCWPDTEHKPAEFNNWVLSWVWFYTELSNSTQDAQIEKKEFTVLHNHTKHYFFIFC